MSIWKYISIAAKSFCIRFFDILILLFRYLFQKWQLFTDIKLDLIFIWYHWFFLINKNRLIHINFASEIAWTDVFIIGCNLVKQRVKILQLLRFLLIFLLRKQRIIVCWIENEQIFEVLLQKLVYVLAVNLRFDIAFDLWSGLLGHHY